MATACDGDELDLCDYINDGSSRGGCPEDPELDLCDGIGGVDGGGCPEDPELDLCDGSDGVDGGGCPDDPESDLCDGITPAPTRPQMSHTPTMAPTTVVPAPTAAPTPAPTTSTTVLTTVEPEETSTNSAHWSDTRKAIGIFLLLAAPQVLVGQAA